LFLILWFSENEQIIIKTTNNISNKVSILRVLLKYLGG
jgi:hypothetical protein